ncbi:MAG TPA: ester cyclase [Candidatus Angelobacter sp.]|nr:ester cyclase [Candidatus Angelobacter sp.]
MRRNMMLVLSAAAACCLLAFAWGEQRRPTAPLPGPRVQERVSPEQHKVVVRRVFDELFSRGNYSAISEIYTQDCIVHHDGKTTRLDESVSEGKGWRSAAPDLQMVPENMSVQGDIVTVSWTARGTHTGRGNGLNKPTGKRFQLRGNSRFRMVNGKIAEVWNDYDRNELFRQIGVSRAAAFLYDQSENLRWTLNRALSSGSSPAIFDR